MVQESVGWFEDVRPDMLREFAVVVRNTAEPRGWTAVQRRTPDCPRDPVWLPASAGRVREAIQRLTTATAFRLKPEATDPANRQPSG
jgi:hypothetical protein